MIGTMTIAEVLGEKPSAPTYLVEVSFDGETDYPTGGTPGIKDIIQDAIQAAVAGAPDANVRGRVDVTPVAVVAYDAGQYIPVYDNVNDKLLVRDGGSATWAELAPHADVHLTTFKVTFACR